MLARRHAAGLPAADRRRGRAILGAEHVAIEPRRPGDRAGRGHVNAGRAEGGRRRRRRRRRLTETPGSDAETVAMATGRVRPDGRQLDVRRAAGQLHGPAAGRVGRRGRRRARTVACDHEPAERERHQQGDQPGQRSAHAPAPGARRGRQPLEPPRRTASSERAPRAISGRVEVLASTRTSTGPSGYGPSTLPRSSHTMPSAPRWAARMRAATGFATVVSETIGPIATPRP